MRINKFRRTQLLSCKIVIFFSKFIFLRKKSPSPVSFAKSVAIESEGIKEYLKAKYVINLINFKHPVNGLHLDSDNSKM